MSTLAHVPAFIPPMLAKASERPPTGPGRAVEIKLDGHRAQVRIAANGELIITSRRGVDITQQYRELVTPLAGLAPGRDVVLDGELVVFNEAGVAELGRLQRRSGPVRFAAFDLLHFDGNRLIQQTYANRRGLLDQLLGGGYGPIRNHPYATDIPPAMALELARIAGHEGIVVKRIGSRYEPDRRSGAWIKTVFMATREIVVCGWRTGDVRRLGSLMMGAYDRFGRLRYLGDVGTGFSERALDAIWLDVAHQERSLSPFHERVDPKGAHWLEPTLVATVRYRCVGAGGLLRDSSWVGFRPEVPLRDVLVPGLEPE